MDDELISRVIMLPSGDVHIALRDKHSLECSPAVLIDFLSDPLEFINTRQFKYLSSTKIVNPRGQELKEIKGLTLLKLFRSLDVVCLFPQLFEAFKEKVSFAPNEIINLNNLILSTHVYNEKHLLLRFFYELTNISKEKIKLKVTDDRKGVISTETMKETYESFFSTFTTHKVTKDKTKGEKDSSFVNITSFENATETASDQVDTDEYVTLMEFAKMHGVPLDTARGWRRLGKLRGVITKGKRVFVNKNSPVPTDGRKTRAKMKEIMPTAYQRPKFGDDGLPGSYKSLQDYIMEREGVSEYVAQYILSYEEMLYYRNNYYNEVNWDGLRALIIDIDPDYYCELLEKTNRQIIADNESPVVGHMVDPSITDVKKLPRWDLHHIGRKMSSPLAVIPEQIHLIEKYSIFHPGKLQKSEIDRNLFKKEKKKFWDKYIEIHDESLGYSGMAKTSLHRVYNSKNEKRRLAAIEAAQKD